MPRGSWFPELILLSITCYKRLNWLLGHAWLPLSPFNHSLLEALLWCHKVHTGAEWMPALYPWIFKNLGWIKPFSVEISASGISSYWQKTDCREKPSWGPVLPSPAPSCVSETATLTLYTWKTELKNGDVPSLLHYLLKHTIDTQWSYIWCSSKRKKKMHLQLWELNIWRNHGIKKNK